jgi:hypothetical protein
LLATLPAGPTFAICSSCPLPLRGVSELLLLPNAWAQPALDAAEATDLLLVWRVTMPSLLSAASC